MAKPYALSPRHGLARAKAGDYFRAFLESARMINDPLTLAHSLNRMGTWLTRIDQPLAGITLHKEAVALLEQMNEKQEVARTLNTIGSSYVCLGNLEQAVLHYRTASTLFRRLADLRGLSSSLTGLTLCGTQYLNSISKWAEQDLVQCIQDGEEALTITQKIGWRGGEALACISLGLALGLPGCYGRALKDAQRGLEIAGEIKHLHWQLLAHIVLGATYLDLLSYSQAEDYLEEALTLSAQTRSNQWHFLILGFLVPTFILQDQLSRAEAVLSSFPRSTPMETIAQRYAWLALAELRFAQGASNNALKLVDQLIRSATSIDEKPEDSMPRLLKLRGEVLMHLGLGVEAKANLELGLKGAERQGAQSLVWRFHVLLGQFYWQRKRYSQSERHYVAARRLIEKLSNTIPDLYLRQTFLQQASMYISAQPAAQATYRRFGGLTKQEYEVATLIAQRRSNQEIANRLVMSEPGVERHLRKILMKLGFNSIGQIRSWMINRQIAQNSKKGQGLAQ